MVLALAALACAQAAAGEMPSQSAAPTAAGQPKLPARVPHAVRPARAGGLTAEQSLALATIEPGGEEAYGNSNDTTEMIVLYTVVLVVVAAAVVVALETGV
jgi:hypothetical protein